MNSKKTTVKKLMTALSLPGLFDVKLRVEKLLLQNCPATWDEPSVDEGDQSALLNAKSKKSENLPKQVWIDLCSVYF